MFDSIRDWINVWLNTPSAGVQRRVEALDYTVSVDHESDLDFQGAQIAALETQLTEALLEISQLKTRMAMQKEGDNRVDQAILERLIALEKFARLANPHLADNVLDPCPF